MYPRVYFKTYIHTYDCFHPHDGFINSGGGVYIMLRTPLFIRALASSTTGLSMEVCVNEEKHNYLHRQTGVPVD